MNLTGYVRALGADAEETRTVEFVASDNSRDSHRTVVPVGKWDLRRFNANGIVGYQHNVYGDLCGNEDPDRVIGTGEARVEGEQLIVRITFEPADLNPLAEKIFRKVMHGTLKAVSVGFLPTKEGHWGEGEEARGGRNETYYFDGQELLEVSVVNIPSNANALRRGFRENTADALRYVYHALGGRYRYAEIEEMKVREILDLLVINDERLGIKDDTPSPLRGTPPNLGGELTDDVINDEGLTIKDEGLRMNEADCDVVVAEGVLCN